MVRVRAGVSAQDIVPVGGVALAEARHHLTLLELQGKFRAHLVRVRARVRVRVRVRARVRVRDRARVRVRG